MLLRTAASQGQRRGASCDEPSAFEDGRELMHWTSEHKVRIDRKKKIAG
jgi:hypothetical protein